MKVTHSAELFYEVERRKQRTSDQYSGEQITQWGSGGAQNAVTSAELAIANLISKEGEWNNCSIRFSNSDDAFFHLFVCCAPASEENDQWRHLRTSSTKFCNEYHLSSSQTCKNTSDDHSVLLLTFHLWVSKFGATITGKPS